MRINNPTDFAFTSVVAFAVIKNSQGEFIDMLWVADFDGVPYGQIKDINISSLSQSGRCVGYRDPNGIYFADIWVSIGDDKRNAISYFENVEFYVP